ncbi:hypothetical protein P3T43_003368 [Paraburkholderia sp. GAS41]|jgi:hypothetical protein|uniref:hypothetical protein n=1 Tax=Paraburkholderia sp. GAS41 TaxID=3035134 RepID=UPI003D1E678C
MDPILTAPNKALLATLIDQDIAHIRRVMEPSLLGDLGGAILPAPYWRKRLHTLLDAEHLTHAQLCAVDGLLLKLDQFEPADLLPEWKTMPPGAHDSRAAPTQRVS